jgi:hypothetical protein
MSRKNVSRQKVSVEEDDEQPTVDEAPALEPTVELEKQAKIDSDVREQVAAADELGRPRGMTLEAQEKWEARQMEKQRTRDRCDDSQTSRREEVCRAMTDAKHCGLSSEPDPREKLDVETHREVHKQAVRLEGKCRGGLGVTAIERELAARVAGGRSMQDAVLDMVDDMQAAPGAIVALGELEKAGQYVDIEATVKTLWEPSNPKILQVGLLEDETGTTKFTSWVRSDVPLVAEGQRVRIREAAKNWYQGRCSVALVGRTHVEFPERDAWW